MKFEKKHTFDIEKRKAIRFLFSLILALLLTLLMLEWKTSKNDFAELNDNLEAYDLDIILLPPIEAKKLTPPQPNIIYSGKVREVDNNTETKTDINFPDAEDYEYKIEQYKNNDKNETQIISPFNYEKRPEFPGGVIALKEHIKNNMQYPPEAIKKNIYGRVIVSFRIARNGNVDKVEVIKNIHPLLDNEAIRIIKKLPKWKAAEIDGKAVASRYIVPVNFVIKHIKNQ